MGDNNAVYCSQYIELSSHKNYLELTNLVCAYDFPNLNNRQLDYGGTEESQALALTKAQTLVDMPVYAKCRKNAKGLATFGSHEARRHFDGTIDFDTIPIGVHTAVEIKPFMVTTAPGVEKELPCLFAKQRIWKRNKNVVAAIERLYKEGCLRNSWEIDVSAYEDDGNGVRHLIDYEFIGNAFLGEDVSPAYPYAQVLEVAQEMKTGSTIADALSQDIYGENEVANLKDVKDNQKEAIVDGNAETIAPPETSEQAEEQTVEALEAGEGTNEDGVATAEDNAEGSGSESASLTMDDIGALLHKALCDKFGYGWVAFTFPEEHVAWYHKENTLQTQFIQVAYEIVGNELRLIDSVDVQLELPIRELNDEFSAKVKEVEALTKEVAELREVKAQYEAAQSQAEEEKKKQEIASLRAYVQKANCFSEEEMAAVEEKIVNLQVAEVKSLVADKLIEMSAVATAPDELKNTAARRNLYNDEETIDRVSEMRKFLGR